MLKDTFSSILKVVEKKIEEDDHNVPDTRLKKWDFKYGVQYFNKFKKLGYRINELTFHIFEHEIISTLCPPIEKSRYQRIPTNLLNTVCLKNCTSNVMYFQHFNVLKLSSRLICIVMYVWKLLFVLERKFVNHKVYIHKSVSN